MHIPERAPTILGPLSLGQPQSQDHGPKDRATASLPSCQALYRDGVECLPSLRLPLDLGTTSAPEPLLQELNIPSALQCVSWGYSSSLRELQEGRSREPACAG